ncbi:unnamed protein product, partial [Bubo scandiacus]
MPGFYSSQDVPKFDELISSEINYVSCLLCQRAISAWLAPGRLWPASARSSGQPRLGSPGDGSRGQERWPRQVRLSAAVLRLILSLAGA